MKIETYKKASDIPKKYLPSLVDSEIECWGSRPFNEYKICSNSECGAIYAIEDIYETIDNYRNRTDNEKANNFECSCCNTKTEFIYEKQNFLEILKEYIKWEVSRVLLLDDNENVEWFGVLSKDTLKNIIYQIFDSRPWSWDREKAILEISKKIFWNDNSREEEFICSHQIYISPFAREWNIAVDILIELFSLNESFRWFPIIGETRYDSKFYPVTRIMGYQDILDDKYWVVLQASNSYNFVLDFFNSIKSFSDKSIFKDILRYKKESLKILKENSNFTTQKFYTNN